MPKSICSASTAQSLHAASCTKFTRPQYNASASCLDICIAASGTFKSDLVLHSYNHSFVCQCIHPLLSSLVPSITQLACPLARSLTGSLACLSPPPAWIDASLHSDNLVNAACQTIQTANDLANIMCTAPGAAMEYVQSLSDKACSTWQDMH